MFGFLNKKKKRPTPYTHFNEEMDYVGISFDEMVEFDVKKIDKTIKNSINKHLKLLPNLSDVDLEKMHKVVTKSLDTRNDIRPDLKKKWAPDKQKILYSEATRLLDAVNEEIQKRKSH